MPRVLIAYQPRPSVETTQSLTPGLQHIVVRKLSHRRGIATRELRAAHVVMLAESITALGLLEPLVVDEDGHILAGAHRLAALQLLAHAMPMSRRQLFLDACGFTEEDSPKDELGGLADRVAQLDREAFHKRYPDGRVPVHVMEIPKREADSLPLAIEVAENSIRRQYTAEEVEDLAARLKKAGYTSRDGRPRKGERTVVAALETILGRSPAQVRRLLKGGKSSGSNWQRAVESFARAAARLRQVENEAPGSTDAKAMLNAARGVLETATGKRVWEKRRIPET